eukprot:8884254-Pyramimonas_sp.AAC.1
MSVSSPTDKGVESMVVGLIYSPGRVVSRTNVRDRLTGGQLAALKIRPAGVQVIAGSVVGMALAYLGHRVNLARKLSDIVGVRGLLATSLKLLS